MASFTVAGTGLADTVTGVLTHATDPEVSAPATAVSDTGFAFDATPTAEGAWTVVARDAASTDLASLADALTVTAAAPPTITSIVPASTTLDTTNKQFTVVGTGFQADNVTGFTATATGASGPVDANNVVIVSDTEATFYVDGYELVPMGATDGPVTVETVGDTAPGAIGQYSYGAPPSLSITDVQPDPATFMYDMNFTVTGTKFQSESLAFYVWLNGAPFKATATNKVIVSDTQATITLDDASQANGQIGPAVVSVQGGMTMTESTYTIAVVAPVAAPIEITDIQPDPASMSADTTFTVTGHGFQTCGVAQFTVQATGETFPVDLNATIVSDTEATFTRAASAWAGAGAQPGPVSVITRSSPTQHPFPATGTFDLSA